MPWGIGAGLTQFGSFYEALQKITDFGFAPVPFLTHCKGSDDIMQMYKMLISKRDEYPIMLDGMVIMLDEIAIQQSLGWTIRLRVLRVRLSFQRWRKALRF